MDFRAPPEWAAMPDDDTPPAERDASWWARHELVSVDLATAEAVALGALLRRQRPRWQQQQRWKCVYLIHSFFSSRQE